MAQRIVDSEQYEAVLVKGNIDGSSLAVNDTGSSLTVDGKAYRSTVTITRPSNTTAYTAGDVVGSTGGSAILTLSNIGPSAGFILIQSAALIFSDSTVPAGMGAFRIHLYNATPTAIADNAPFDLTSGERAAYMGYIDLSAPQDLGSTIYTQIDYPGRLIKLAAASTTLFAEIETRGAYTPVSASTVELRVSTLEAGL
jgi:malic enzyme